MSEYFSLLGARDHHAEPVLARIRAQAEKAPARVSEVLSYIERNLFERDLSAALKARFARPAPNPLKAAFTRAAGSPLARYIRDRRMQVAAVLLEHTDHPYNEIGIAVGYERSAFYKAFPAWPPSGGRGPSEWRAQARGAEPIGPGTKRPTQTTEVESRLAGWRRALLLPWILDEAEGDPVEALLRHPGVQLMVHLVRHYPGVADRCRRFLGRKPTGQRTAGEEPVRDEADRLVTSLAFESFKAKRLEEALAKATSPLDVACLRAASPMKSFVHFHVLSRGSGAAAARESLDPCHPSVADLLPSYRAKATLAVAREALAAGELHAAELELGLAEVQLTTAGPWADPETQPGILATRAELSYRLGRYAEAAEAAGRAAEAYRRLGRTRLAAEAVLLREAACGRGGTGESAAELEAALASVDEAASPDIVAQLAGALAVAYARQGQREKAAAALARLLALCSPKEKSP